MTVLARAVARHLDETIGRGRNRSSARAHHHRRFAESADAGRSRNPCSASAGSCPVRGCRRPLASGVRGWGRVYSGGQAGDGGIVAEGGDGFQRHGTGSLDGPFVVLFEQDRTDEPFERVGAAELRPMRGGGAHVGVQVGVRVVHEGGDPRLVRGRQGAGPDLLLAGHRASPHSNFRRHRGCAPGRDRTTTRSLLTNPMGTASWILGPRGGIPDPPGRKHIIDRRRHARLLDRHRARRRTNERRRAAAAPPVPTDVPARTGVSRAGSGEPAGTNAKAIHRVLGRRGSATAPDDVPVSFEVFNGKDGNSSATPSSLPPVGAATTRPAQCAMRERISVLRDFETHVDILSEDPVRAAFDSPNRRNGPPANRFHEAAPSRASARRTHRLAPIGKAASLKS